MAVKRGLRAWTLVPRNPGHKSFSCKNCSTLDKPFNLSELLFSQWEIWKIIIPKFFDLGIIIIPN